MTRITTCLMVGLLSTVALAQSPKASSNVIPQPTLVELAGQYVSPDAAMTDAAKTRRYNLMLARGKVLAERFPDALNLYELRGLMLRAAQGLAVVEPSDKTRQRMLDLAGRIVNSDAPDEARMPADLLLTYAQIAAHERDSHGAAVAIARFADRYYESDVEAEGVTGGRGPALDQAVDAELFRDVARRSVRVERSGAVRIRCTCRESRAFPGASRPVSRLKLKLRNPAYSR